MPYDSDSGRWLHWPSVPQDSIFGVVKGDNVGGEALIEVSQEHLALLNKAFEATDDPIFDASILKKTADSFKAFTAAEKVPDVEEEEVSNHWAHVRGMEMLVYYPRSTKQAGRYDQDETVNPGWLNYYNIKDLLARFFVSVHAEYGKVRNWREMCIGITSLSHENKHLPMFDYDGKNIKTLVKKDIKKLQKQFGLGDASIYETRKGLHVYFFSDFVTPIQYTEMLNSVNCCKGFKNSFEKNGYSVLRLSAKYTEFDILPYKVIISPNRGATRPGRKAALIQELLRMGRECGTHFASLYPQWSHFKEDLAPWKVGGKKSSGRRVRKLSFAEYKKKQEGLRNKKTKVEENRTHKMTFTSENAKSVNNWIQTVVTSNVTVNDWTQIGTSEGSTGYNQYIVKTTDGTYK